MEVTPTGYVILGMLGWRSMSGYEIKSLVDYSTRFFWAASYSQIYPELRRLADEGLIAGEAKPQGGRKRNEYRLTPVGRKALRSWLEREPEVFELRDEGLLKLFFAGVTDGQTAPATLEAKQAHHEEVVQRLREIEATGTPEGFAYMVLRYGIDCNEFMAAWCQRERHALAKAKATGKRKAA
jgi:PadR family transcriptional regulator AphA